MNIRTSRKYSLAIFFLFLVSLAGGLPPANLAPVPTASVDSITPTELRMHLEFLASNELGGRYTLSPNFAIVARYLASQLQSYGFRGVGDHGDFLQHFGVISSKPDAEKSGLSITAGGQTTNYSFGDFYTLTGGVEGKAEGQIVFVGAGISSPSQHRDDYANLDVKGKIVLIIGGMGPDPRTPRSESGERAAASHGAVGVLQIPSQRFAEFMKMPVFKDRFAARETVRLAKQTDARIPALVLTPALADKLLSSIGLSLKEVQEAENDHKALSPKVTNASASMTVAFHQRPFTTQNVVGKLDGTDPELKKEYVIISAHYDHLEANEKGEIYPGADDDGSGTTSVLAIAHAMALDRPKRSILVIFHAGEELGLLGSEYNTDYAPAVPLENVLADLNIDMIGRSKPPGDEERLDAHLSDANTIYLVGSNRLSKELHKISEDTNSQYQKLKLDYYYNDPSNPERIYYRSDHWNYAKHGIPVIFYFDGIHVDYHKPTDTVDKIDFNKMTSVARLVFETGWRLANLDHHLARDVN
ncbi:MAG TPA: M28 family peptidase [Candidatus Angelobacter sp.]|nr:M28 family peptidase [Candidatus Angelobacter sp.]